MARYPWHRALAAGRFQLLAAILVVGLAADLVLDLVGAGSRGQHVALSTLLLLGALVLTLVGALESRRQARERRSAEHAVQASRERLEEILENSTNLFYSHTPDHRLTYVSPQTRGFLGCEPEEALRRWTELVTDNPVNRRGLALTEVAVRTGERQPVYELELERTDGRRIWVEVNEAPVVRDGRTVAVVGALTDVTERKRVVEEHERLEERLRLGQRLEAVGRLAGGVAHDFNNFLTAILGYCDLLALQLGDEHPLLREVGEIRRAGRRAAGLIEQLLAFSRRQVIAPRVLDLNTIAADASRLIRRLIGEDVELQCRLAPEPLLVEADPSQLEQVLLNLAANARDAMPSGGRFVLTTERRRLDSARPGDMFEVEPGEYCRITVTDSGEGMDPETLAHLFEPFYTTKQVGRGTGLGLASVYGVIKQNRGYIWVESAPGEGAKFEIYLPWARSALQAEPEAPAESGLAGRPAREATILLVEDEDSVRSLIHEVLTGRGYRVLEAGNAARAIERSAGHPGRIDLLVTDLVMPGVQGDSLARGLARDRPGLAVLYISGYTESVLTQRGVLQEGHRLLRKPFTPDELVAAVAEALDAAPVDSSSRVAGSSGLR
jgi:PAS domain S-box-containing protein